MTTSFDPSGPALHDGIYGLPHGPDEARVVLVVRVRADEASVVAASSLVEAGALDPARVAELVGAEFDLAMGNAREKAGDPAAFAAALEASEPLAARLATLGLTLERVEPAA